MACVSWHIRSCRKKSCSCVVWMSSELSRDAPSGCSVGLDDDGDFFSWRVCFEGPPDTYYEGGIFGALLKFPQDFPNNPPEMIFEQDMWHPNGTTLNAYGSFIRAFAKGHEMGRSYQKCL